MSGILIKNKKIWAPKSEGYLKGTLALSVHQSLLLNQTGRPFLANSFSDYQSDFGDFHDHLQPCGLQSKHSSAQSSYLKQTS